MANEYLNGQLGEDELPELHPDEMDLINTVKTNAADQSDSGNGKLIILSGLALLGLWWWRG